MTAIFMLHDAMFATQGHLHQHSLDYTNDVMAQLMAVSDCGLGGFQQYLVNKALAWGSQGSWDEFVEADYANIDGKVLSCYHGL